MKQNIYVPTDFNNSTTISYNLIISNTPILQMLTTEQQFHTKLHNLN